MKKTKLNIEFPRVDMFSDYHEIYERETFYKTLGKVKAIEVTGSSSIFLRYLGLFYIGKKPSSKDIQLLIEEKLNTL